jgi:CHAT domain-containing protein/Tfp pilus assembly protein PilF
MKTKKEVLQRFKIGIALIYFFVVSFQFAQAPSTINNDTQSNEYLELFEKGEIARLKGNYHESLALFAKAYSIANKENYEQGMLHSLLGQALLNWNIGNISIALDKYRQSFEIAKKLDEQIPLETSSIILSIFHYYNEGKEYRKNGNYDKSIESFSIAIELSRKIKSKEHELKCLRQQSLNYWDLERLQDFLNLNKEALTIAIKINHVQEQASCLNNIGLFYWKLDNYSEALKYYERAHSLARMLGDLEGQAECLNNISIAYYDLGEFDKALEYLTGALKIDRQLKNDSFIAKDLNNIGEAFRRKGLQNEKKDDFIVALRYFGESLELARKIIDKDTEVRTLNNLGAVYSHLNDTYKALEFFKLALNKAEEIHNTELIGMLLNNIGIVNAQLGNYEESTKYYQRAIDLALDIKGGKILWEAYLELANAFKNQNQYELALDNYKKSISVIENIRSGLNLEEFRATYFGTDKRIEAYQNIIDLYIKLNQKDPKSNYEEKAFYFFERAKARAFLDSIEVSKVDLTEGIGQKYLNEETDLMNEISKIHTRFLTPQLTPEQRKGLDDELVRLESQLESLKRKIREASPAYANLKYPKTIELVEAQNDLIDGETAFFAYMLAKENSYGFAITRNSFKIFSLPARKKIQDSVQEYLKSITDVQTRDFHLGHELYKHLVQPGLSKRIKKIVFIPDDILYFLPFEALLTNGNSQDWLIKKYNISYAPSLSSLRELIERKKAAQLKSHKDILAVGDPSFGDNEIEPSSDPGQGAAFSEFSMANPKFNRLEYSGLETEKIATLFKSGKKDILEREQASEDTLKQLPLADYKIIHFATHAIIDDKKPGRSAIVLTLDQDPKEDGLLQMREVFNLKLNADLITLSACQTGLGQLIRGEGIEGLSRAFFYAGASSVLLSLWAINDQASYQLLERFYFHLRSSDSIMNALRQAKLELIDSDVLNHPYYWSGFVIIGDADKVVFPRRMHKWIVVTLSLCAGLALFIFIINRDKSPILGFKS